MRVRPIRVCAVESGGVRPVILDTTTDDGTVGLGGDAAAAIPSGSGRSGRSMVDQSFWAEDGGSIGSAAMSAIEQALTGIEARALGAPAYDRLDGRVHDAPPADASGRHLGGRTVADLPRFAEAAVADGYHALRAHHTPPIASGDRGRSLSRCGKSASLRCAQSFALRRAGL